MIDVRRLTKRFGERFTKLDAAAVQALVTARVEGAVTNGRMQELTGGHPTDITGVLQGLVRDGFLEQQNQRRWASYRMAGDSPRSSPQPATDSPQSLPDSPQIAPDSPQSAPTLPVHLQPLLPIAEPARSRRRLPAERMRAVIEALCVGRWLSATEIAALVSRDAEKLQSRFLTAMVREGHLELRHPAVPNRPDQAYRTIAPSP